MSLGGGGSSAPTSSTVTQSSLPTYAEPYFTSLMQGAVGAAARPYQQYQGQQVADFSPFQTQAMNQLTSMNPVPGASNEAGQIGTNVANTATGVEQNAQNFNPNIQAQQTGINDWTSPGTSQQFMSPYTQNVLDAQKQNMDVDYQRSLNQTNEGAVQSGAFGGDRQAIEDSALNRTYQQQLQGMEATGLQNAYNQGASQFNTQNQLGLQSQQGNQNANLQAQNMNANYGLGGINAQISALNPQLQAGQSLGYLAPQQQQMALNYNQALQGMGNMQQTQQQNLLNTAYNNWQNAGNWNQNQMNWYGGILHGVPVTPQNTQTNIQAAPSMVSGLAGLGTAAAGLSNMNGGH